MDVFDKLLNQQQGNLILCMIVSIPISFILKLINQKYLFLALSITVTLAFQTFLFPNECYFLWIQQQLVYALILFAPRKIVGHCILVESFLALSLVQIRRIYIAYGVNGVDITGIFMMQFFVWVGMGYNYQNGAKVPQSLTHDQQKRMIKERPNYITYLGYVNFLPACLIGPVYEYRDYEDYLHRVHDYAHIPSPFKAMAQEACIFILSLIVHLTFAQFKIDDLLTQSWADYGLLQKFAYLHLIIIGIEFKYISAWSLGMISMQASGFPYNPSHNHHKKDGSIDYSFDRVKVTDFKKFYLNSSLKSKAEGWNVSVQIALKRYIYQQIHNTTKKYHDEKERKKTMNKAQLATLMMSGVWHGFYPAYIITFFHWALCVQLCAEVWKFKTKHKKIKHLVEKYPVLDLIQNIIWTFAIVYFGIPVPLLLWSKIKIYLAETYCIPFIILYITYFLVMEKKILSKILAKYEGRESIQEISSKKDQKIVSNHQQPTSSEQKNEKKQN